VIELRDINVKIAELKELIQGELSHTYLQKYIQTPILDEDKLLLLYTMFKEKEIGEQETVNYALTTMLVQVALDTHELVTNSPVNISSQDKLKKRQLTVLAGDYYSGLYYYFLARSEDVTMIRILAEGIKDVNEHKINLYRRDTHQVDTWMKSLEMIESSLFRKVSEHLNLTKWSEFSSKFLLLKRLLQERERYNKEGFSIVIDALQKIVNRPESSSQNEHNTEEILNVYDTYIDHVRELLVQAISKGLKMNDVLEARINELFFRYEVPFKKIVEEG
jgi:heptaprenyl diphosphate synthase